MARRAHRRRAPAHCVAFINTTFNNTIISITDPEGAVVCWSSAGRVGFKGSKKGTPYAAGVCSETAAKEAAALGVKLAQPGRQVVTLIGDGDFMMAMQELTTAVQLDVPILVVIINHKGWRAIKDLQMAA